MLIVFLALTCSANARPKGYEALAKTAAPKVHKGLVKNADAASAIAEDLAKSQLSAVVGATLVRRPVRSQAHGSDFDLRHAFTSGEVGPAPLE